ncbi:MAG: hypothetical protein ABSB74_10330 [Tepidisphaeraceae bacterium]
MNADELAEATKKYDKEFVADEARPLTAAERKVFESARRRGPVRPRMGKSAEKINITIERGLLRETDGLASKSGKSRSELIAESLRLLLRRRAS